MKSCLIWVSKEFREDFENDPFKGLDIVRNEVGYNRDTGASLVWLQGEDLPDWLTVTIDNAMNRPLVQVVAHDEGGGKLRFEFRPIESFKVSRWE